MAMGLCNVFPGLALDRIPARESIAPYGTDPPFALEWLLTDRHSRNTQRGPK